MSDFKGLNTALSALQTYRRGLELAAQNVANTSTDGYSRQRLDLESVGAPANAAFWSRYVGEGGGVRVADVTRYRDQFMEIQAALEHGALEKLQVDETVMQRIEQLFQEPGDSGLAHQLSEFWAGFDDVANHPEELASRTQLLERAKTLAGSFNAISAALSQHRVNTLTETSATVTRANTLADQIAELNDQIKTGVIVGQSVNELMDKRDLLAIQLAELTGATIRPAEYGQVNVLLSGMQLVHEGRAEHLELDTSASPVVVRWEATSSVIGLTSGKIGGQLSAVNTTIPAYVTRLDDVATTLRDDVNRLHGSITGSIDVADQDQSAAGNLQFELALDGGAYATVTVPGADWSGAGGAAALQAALQAAVDGAIGAGNATATVTGGAGSALAVTVAPTATHTLAVRAVTANAGMATLLGTTAVGLDGVGGRQFFAGTTAETLTLSADVEGEPNAVAAGIASRGPLDVTRALELADLATAGDGADAVYRQMIVQVGVDTQVAKSRADIQSKATESLDSARSQYSGVSNDEELMHMVEFQHAYEAAARLMSAIDEMLDTLINRTGAR
jgi:flagellar hook-associated protein 1 FlgK